MSTAAESDFTNRQTRQPPALSELRHFLSVPAEMPRSEWQPNKSSSNLPHAFMG